MHDEEKISNKELLLVHLSDIHFNKNSGGSFDLDEDLRLSLEKDASVFVNESSRKVNGILITGDIAYSGKKDEYEQAKRWLNSLCNITSCPVENVWTVPGNHDVDRSIIDKSKLINTIHKELRSARLSEINKRIEDFFSSDESAQTLLHSPLSHYMGFNKLYEGNIKKDGSLYWEYPLPLNDESLLMIRGLNTTLVSNALDDYQINKLILGEKQVHMPINNPRVAYLTMCHHPLDWLKDKDNVESFLNNRALVQLYGHKHDQNILKVNNSLRIVAGATHPARGESHWLPRFNFLAIYVDRVGNARKLIVKIYPRKWSKEYTRFMADFDKDGLQVRKYVLDLPDLESVSDKSIDIISATEETNELKCDVILKESTNQTVMIENPNRKLVYRFYMLSFDMRYRIAQDLKLVCEEDDGIEEADLFKNVFSRAKDNKLLWSLWEKVEKAHGYEKLSENPFRGLKEGDYA